MKKLFAGLMAVFIACSSLLVTLTSSAEEDLLGTGKSELLGIASAFSVFVENDFGCNGSDCEGRIACGGGANVGNFQWYSTSTKTNYASVIVGRGPLCNFDSGNRIFVVGTECPDNDIQVSGTVYKADLIDFESEFTKLRTISQDLKEETATAAKVENSWCNYITFKGTNSDYNFFTIDASAITSCQTFIEFDVPEDSYSVVTVLGDNIDLYT